MGLWKVTFRSAQLCPFLIGLTFFEASACGPRPRGEALRGLTLSDCVCPPPGAELRLGLGEREPEGAVRALPG